MTFQDFLANGIETQERIFNQLTAESGALANIVARAEVEETYGKIGRDSAVIVAARELVVRS